jgi:pimeloyl-ACP methyl ester carboxylesterase
MKRLRTSTGDIEYRFAPAHAHAGRTIVFLHEGLGSASMWRDFPERLTDATGCRALVYSRLGYGGSEGLAGPRSADFMHVEALTVLPELLDRLEIRAPVLFGHSDGGSIALIHAAAASRKVEAVIALAPHVMVEPITLRSIAAARRAFQDGDLRQRLARYHHDPDGAFRGWCDIWLAPEFAAWSIEDLLPAIGCAVLAIQGEEDAYGTMAQIDRIAERVRGARLLKLAACGHSPHRDQPDRVLSAVAEFIHRLPGHVATAPTERAEIAPTGARDAP